MTSSPIAYVPRPKVRGIQSRSRKSTGCRGQAAARRQMFQRHDLCYVRPGASPQSPCTPAQRQLFDRWLACGYPLIYTRQPEEIAAHSLQLAIPHMDSKVKQRFACLIDRQDIHAHSPLPLLSDVFAHQALVPGYEIRVFGSYGWQYLTKEAYVHAQSDLDLLISCEQLSLSALAMLLADLRQRLGITRIDAEIRLPGFGDCALTELLNPAADTLLFKTPQTVMLVRRDALYENHPTQSV